MTEPSSEGTTIYIDGWQGQMRADDGQAHRIADAELVQASLHGSPGLAAH